MSKIVNLKTCAKTLVMLSVIAAPVAQAVAQANKEPAEVIARRLANKKAKQQTPSVATKKAKAAGVQLYGYVLSSETHTRSLQVLKQQCGEHEPFKLFQSATCDYFTGKIYWAMLDKDYWATRIIEIDSTTGKGTEVCNFIDNNA